MSFSNVRVTREQQVEESINILVRKALAARGYHQDSGDQYGWKMLESYPYDLQQLDTNLIASGFDFDDGGKQFEIGSNMKERKYTFEFFIFGMNPTMAKGLANAIKYSVEVDQAIPVYDLSQSPPVPNGEWMELDLVHSRREIVPEPEPWQEFTWRVIATVTDWYTPIDT